MTDETNQNEKQLSLEEAILQTEASAKAAQMNNRFVKIANHETIKLPFANPPIIKEKTLTGTDGKTGLSYTSKQIEFELRAKTPNGETKIWSIGVNNKIVGELLELMKKGVFDISIHREGEGTATKYSVSKERAL